MAADGSLGADADPTRWRDAREWFQKRRPVLRDGAARTEADARLRAFRVAGITSVGLVTEVHQAIDAAIADGTTLDDFKKRVGAQLAEAWGAPNARRVETIFRTNVQSAYNAGRFAEMARPAVLAVRPFWKFVSILDGRTTATCAPLNGVIRPHDDRFWESHFPPLHFNCRSTVVSLSRGETERAGGAKKPPEAKPPGEGFGTRPDLAGADLKLTPKAEVALREAHRARSERGPGSPDGSPSAPTPAPHAFSPTGTPVGAALNVQAGPLTPVLTDAVAAIERVHGDGVLDRIEVQAKRGAAVHGDFEFTRLGPPARIRVSTDTQSPRLSLFHEIGHFLDMYALAPPRRGSSAMREQAASIQALHRALLQSAPVRYLTNLSTRKVVVAPERPGGPARRHPVDAKYATYMIDPAELFCRAYAQYIATRSGDVEALAELARLRRRRVPIDYPEQWGDEEFAPIAAEFDKLFEALGWMTPTSHRSTSPGTLS